MTTQIKDRKKQAAVFLFFIGILVLVIITQKTPKFNEKIVNEEVIVSGKLDIGELTITKLKAYKKPSNVCPENEVLNTEEIERCRCDYNDIKVIGLFSMCIPEICQFAYGWTSVGSFENPNYQLCAMKDCKAIEEEIPKDVCFLYKALSENEREICEKIADKTIKEKCKNHTI